MTYGRMLILIPIKSFGSWHKNDMVRIIKRLEFAHLCISLQQITLPLGNLIKLPLLPFTAQPSLPLLPLFGLKTPYTLSIHYTDHPLCFPVIIKKNMCNVAQSSNRDCTTKVKKQTLFL